jgi:ubiquitin carboxyl-terminal hydrolase 25/28
VHHGSVEFGHYYIYIYDFEKDVWRKYNDSEVTEVHNRAEIFGHHNLQNPPTPYFLVYVHDGIKDRLVQPVCREIEEASPSQPSVEEISNVEAEKVRSTETPMENDVEMGDPPAYREVDKTSAGMECHYIKAGNLDGNDAIAVGNGTWGKKVADICDAEW